MRAAAHAGERDTSPFTVSVPRPLTYIDYLLRSLIGF
jgi:hypothetical protein